MKIYFEASQNDYDLILELKARVAILVILASTIMENERDLIKFYVLVSLRYINKESMPGVVQA